ncbi:hypothetical protein Bbelb_120950, partial [Branchiostoma belcheri]
MELRTVVLFALVAGGFSVPLSSVTDDQCSRHCTESNVLDYRIGRTYRYRYDAKTTTQLVGSSDDTSGLEIAATVDLEVLSKCELVLRLSDVDLKEASRQALMVTSSNKREFQRALERHPLRFSFQDGVIPEICPSAEEETWVVNIKRGILSALQNSYLSQRRTDMEEFRPYVTTAFVGKNDPHFGTQAPKQSHTRSANKDGGQRREHAPRGWLIQSEDCRHGNGRIALSTDVTGSCDVEYEAVDERGLTTQYKRTKTFQRCSDRRLGSETGIQANFYNKQSDRPHILDSNQECTHTVDSNSVIESVTCTERHLLRPFSHGENGATVRSTQTLQLTPQRPRTKSSLLSGLGFSRSDLRFEHDSRDSQSAAGRVEQTLRDLCAQTAEDVRPETPALFSRLVYQMRAMNVQEMRSTVARAEGICNSDPQKMKKFALDAIPLVHNEASARLVKEYIMKGEVTGEQADAWLAAQVFAKNPTPQMIAELQYMKGEVTGEQADAWLASQVFAKNPTPQMIAELQYMKGEVTGEQADAWLASQVFAKNPTPQMIAELQPLCEGREVRRSAFLSLSALIHKYCQAESDCAQRPEIRNALAVFQRNLGEKCHSFSDKEEEKMMMSLKAIGNAGQAVSAAPTLSQCVLTEANPSPSAGLPWRPSAAYPAPSPNWALLLHFIEESNKCMQARTALTNTFLNREEDSEVRIAAYIQAALCPSHDFFKIVKRAMETEDSSQVGSYVWSHLQQVLKRDDEWRSTVQYTTKLPGVAATRPQLGSYVWSHLQQVLTRDDEWRSTVQCTTKLHGVAATRTQLGSYVWSHLQQVLKRDDEWRSTVQYTTKLHGVAATRTHSSHKLGSYVWSHLQQVLKRDDEWRSTVQYTTKLHGVAATRTHSSPYLGSYVWSHLQQVLKRDDEWRSTVQYTTKLHVGSYVWSHLQQVLKRDDEWRSCVQYTTKLPGAAATRTQLGSYVWSHLQQVLKRDDEWRSTMQCTTKLHGVAATRTHNSPKLGSYVWSHLQQVLKRDDEWRITVQCTTKLPVGSYVWSHLQQVLKRDDEWRSTVSDILRNRDLEKKFTGDKRKFSSAWTGSVFSDRWNLGGEAQTGVIFSDTSFLPRSAHLNLTMMVFGAEMNMLEVGGRIEGLSYLAESFFGHQGYFPENNVLNLLKTKEKRSVLKENKLEEVHRKFNAKQENQPEGSYYVRMYGDEMLYGDFKGLDIRAQQQGWNVMEIMMKLARQQDYEITKSTMFLDSTHTVPTSTGLPLRLAINGTATTNVKVSGKMDVRNMGFSPRSMHIEGQVMPSAAVEIASEMGIDAHVARCGMKMVTTLHSSTFADGKIILKKGSDLEVKLNMPRDKMEIVNVQSKVFLINQDQEYEVRGVEAGRVDESACSGTWGIETFGLQMCGEVQYPNPRLDDQTPYMPLTGPMSASVTLNKADAGLDSYVMEARYNIKPSRVNGKKENTYSVHFLLDTPGSRIDRKMELNAGLNIAGKAVEMSMQHPKKSLTFN